MCVLGPVLLLLLVGCSVGSGQAGHRVTYTVESSSPIYLGPLSITYLEGHAIVEVQTPQLIKTWSVDVWVSDLVPAELSARIPEQTLDTVEHVVGPAATYPVHCRIAVDGAEVSNQWAYNQCLTKFALYGHEGGASEQVPATTHPPELWPVTTAPSRPTSTAPAGPRPKDCRYATDDEITDIVSRSGAVGLVFAGVDDRTFPFTCFYRFSLPPVAGVPVMTAPSGGVGLIRYPVPFAREGPRGDPVPGLPSAERMSDQEIRANVPGGALTVRVLLGSGPIDRTVSAEVFRLLRDRV
jgi:hypothetical protein